MEYLLTESARRALKSASRIASDAQAASIEPRHLLWALAREESRAAELMNRHGLTYQELQVCLPLQSNQAEKAPNSIGSTFEEIRKIAAEPQQSEALQRVILEARGQAALAGHQVEIGSEHLLFGLAVIDSPAAQFLRQYGMDAESLQDLVTRNSGVSSEPIATDITLNGSESASREQSDTLRILDAAANRAREGLRVLEDYTRFVLDDAGLTERLKTCRHDLAEALRAVEGLRLVATRETQQDVGTDIRTGSETQRDSLRDVVEANCKRVEESLRTLEEFGKIVSPDLGEALGQLRYRVYTLEKILLTNLSSRERLADRSLYLLVTESLCRSGWESAVRGALAAGAGIIQLREKAMTDRELLKRGQQLRQWTREAGALLIMNDRPDLAVLIEADGVHVGQDELTVHQARRIVGPNRLIGVSTHSIEQARQAVLDGADYIGVGPVFSSQTKQFDQLAGIQFVEQAAAEINLPWYAIGGISLQNVDQVQSAGATRIAVSGAVCAAENPRMAAVELLQKLQSENT